jgi:hypothetical protein
VRRFLHVSRLGLGSRIGRVHKQTDSRGCGYQIVQQPQSFRHQLGTQLGHAGDVATRPVQAGHQAKLDRVTGRLEDDRNGSGRTFGCEGCGRAGRCDHAYPSAHQIGHQSRKSIVVPLRPMVFDRDVLALDVTSFAYALPKCGPEVLVLFGCADIHETDNRHRRLLCTRRERPCNRRAAEKRDELAPPHVRSHAQETVSYRLNRELF